MQGRLPNVTVVLAELVDEHDLPLCNVHDHSLLLMAIRIQNIYKYSILSGFYISNRKYCQWPWVDTLKLRSWTLRALLKIRILHDSIHTTLPLFRRFWKIRSRRSSTISGISTLLKCSFYEGLAALKAILESSNQVGPYATSRRTITLLSCLVAICFRKALLETASKGT